MIWFCLPDSFEFAHKIQNPNQCEWSSSPHTDVWGEELTHTVSDFGFFGFRSIRFWVAPPFLFLFSLFHSSSSTHSNPRRTQTHRRSSSLRFSLIVCLWRFVFSCVCNKNYSPPPLTPSELLHFQLLVSVSASPSLAPDNFVPFLILWHNYGFIAFLQRSGTLQIFLSPPSSSSSSSSLSPFFCLFFLVGLSLIIHRERMGNFSAICSCWIPVIVFAGC